MSILFIKNLTVAVGKKEVAKGVDLAIRPEEIHALMGPNGSGKSSLANAVAGHPEYRVTSGVLRLGDTDLLALAPEERAKSGLFLSFQEPPEVGGVSMRVFLSSIKNTGVQPLFTGVEPLCESLRISKLFLDRFLNEGFSGGEKKKSELLQFLARRPKFAIFDEVDSGLDLDSLRVAAEIMVNAAQNGAGILLITHSPRIFDYLHPDRIHFMLEGRIAASGGRESIHKLQEGGYKAITHLAHV